MNERAHVRHSGRALFTGNTENKQFSRIFFRPTSPREGEEQLLNALFRGDSLEDDAAPSWDVLFCHLIVFERGRSRERERASEREREREMDKSRTRNWQIKASWTGEGKRNTRKNAARNTPISPEFLLW